jgi:hypothetical protein
MTSLFLYDKMNLDSGIFTEKSYKYPPQKKTKGGTCHRGVFKMCHRAETDREFGLEDDEGCTPP